MWQVWLYSGLGALFPQWEGEKLGLGKMNGLGLRPLCHGLQRMHSPSLHQSGLPIEGPPLSLLSDLQPFVLPERNFSSAWVTQECNGASSRSGPTIKSRFSSFFVSWTGWGCWTIRAFRRKSVLPVFSVLLVRSSVEEAITCGLSGEKAWRVRPGDNVCTDLTG